MARLELAASCSQSRRATNCATPGYFVVLSGWAYSPKAGAIPVAVPCKSGVRQSGLAFCRPRPRARLPQSATGGGRLASPLGYTRVCRTYRQGILYMKPRKNATPKCGNPAAFMRGGPGKWENLRMLRAYGGFCISDNRQAKGIIGAFLSHMLQSRPGWWHLWPPDKRFEKSKRLNRQTEIPSAYHLQDRRTQDPAS